MFGKDEVSRVFNVGEIIESGAGPNRKNAANLKIISIDDEFIRYQSIRSASKSHVRYSYLKLLLDDFASLNPRSIQNSVNAVLKRGGFKSDYSTENYAYSLAKAFHERTSNDFFLSTGEAPLQDKIESDPEFLEGKRVAVWVERIERDDKAREACIRHFGAICKACKFNFESIYGALGKGYIHVHHHVKQLASTRGEYIIDPVQDLILLCPNCHAMVHRRKDMLTISELQDIIGNAVRKPTLTNMQS